MNLCLQQKLWEDWLHLWRLSYGPRNFGVLVNNELVNVYSNETQHEETPVLPPLVIICDTNE